MRITQDNNREMLLEYPVFVEFITVLLTCVLMFTVSFITLQQR